MARQTQRQSVFGSGQQSAPISAVQLPWPTFTEVTHTGPAALYWKDNESQLIILQEWVSGRKNRSKSITPTKDKVYLEQIVGSGRDFVAAGGQKTAEIVVERNTMNQIPDYSHAGSNRGQRRRILKRKQHRSHLSNHNSGGRKSWTVRHMSD